MNILQGVTKKSNRWLRVAMVFAILLVTCSWSNAQSGAGVIQGTVRDATGAVIPQAAIHVVNNATKITIDTTTNSVGFYIVPSLFVGTYTVSASAPGMSTYSTVIELQVAQTGVINPILTAGSVTQKIEVSADTIQLTNTESGTISNTLDNARINQLPMNGRMLLTLASDIVPGLENTGGRANGLMDAGMEYVQDGAPMTNREFGGESSAPAQQTMLPDSDAVQEVSIQTMNSPAQFSTPAIGIITTKSGTDQLHGSFFETARNNGWGIAKSRSNAANYAAPHYVRNEFGASAGGPIILPHVYHGQNKSFWFFAYERYSLRSNTTEIVKVPTMAMRNGDFSGLTDSSGLFHQLYDPATTAPSSDCNGSGTANQWCRAPFVNNQIPIGRLAPATKTLYDITPAPTLSYNPLVQGNIIAPNIYDQTIPTITLRLDHHFNENNQAYLRYTHLISQQSSLRNYPSNSAASVAADGFPEGATGYQDVPSANFSGAVGYTHIFSPTFYSETVLSQQWFNENVTGGGNPSLNYANILGLPDNFGETGFPYIGNGLLMPYGGTEFNYQVSQIVSIADENLTKTVGRHLLHFGGRFQHERFGSLPDRGADQIQLGAYATGLEDPTSGASYAITTRTGYEDADFFLGAASSYSVTKQPPYTRYRDMEFDAYFQDDYHVNSNLTVNIGLRWEAHPAVYTGDGLMKGLDLKTHAIVLPKPTSYYVDKGYTTQTILTNATNIGAKFETPEEAGYPTALMRNYNLTFGPRLGFAYQLFGGKWGTVLRGGYGRYIYPIPVRNELEGAESNMPFSASYSQSYVTANQSPDGLQNYLLRSPQTVVMGQNSSSVVNSGNTNSILPGIVPTALNPDFPPYFVTQVNVTLEQRLKGNSALRLSYLWVHGSNLDQAFRINNQPSTYVWMMEKGTYPPQGSTIGSNQYAATATGPWDQTTFGNSPVWEQKSGWSTDNALQVNFQRLFHNGTAFQIFYVWSSPFRVGGNGSRDSVLYPYANFFGTGIAGSGAQATMTSPYGTVIAPALPLPSPAGVASYLSYRSLNFFENHQRDSATPYHHIRFNGIVDLPFGRGKRYLGNVNRLMDEIVGGYQLAGAGQVVSQSFQVTSSNWGPTQPIHVYKHSHLVTDCRSGTCVKAYQWFNGYLAPTVINQTGGVYGLPTDYLSRAYQTPIDVDSNKNDAAYKYYNTNPVFITSANIPTVEESYSPGPSGVNPFAHTFLNGPFNYNFDLSLFKVFPITERTNLRFNIDAFNAGNIQGWVNPGTNDGIEEIAPQVASSYWSPRQVQFTLRYTF